MAESASNQGAPVNGSSIKLEKLKALKSNLTELIRLQKQSEAACEGNRKGWSRKAQERDMKWNYVAWLAKEIFNLKD